MIIALFTWRAHGMQDPGLSKAEVVGQLLTELARDPGAMWLLWTDVQVNPRCLDETSHATKSGVRCSIISCKSHANHCTTCHSSCRR